MDWTASDAKRRHSLPLCLKSTLTFGLLAGLTLAAATGAFAAASDWRDYYTPRRAMARAEATKPRQEMPAPHFAVISIADQRVVFYGADGVAAQSPVSTGTRSNPTPTGIFSIVQKKRFHRSNLYSDAPMPFMQRITWSGIALHAGVLPGYPASHGCIRMPGGFAQRIFGATRMGQRVIISPTTVTPASIAHKNLPAPAFIPEAEGPAEASVQVPEATATIAQNEPREAGKVEAVSLLAAPVEVKRLNPEEYARQLKQAANAKAREAARAIKAAQLALVTRTADARMAIRKVSSAEAALRNARDKLEAATKKVQRAEAEKVENEKDRAEKAEKAAAKAEKAAAREAEKAAAREAEKAEAKAADAQNADPAKAEAAQAEAAKAEAARIEAANAEAAKAEAAKAEAAKAEAKIEAAKAEDEAAIARANEARTAAEAAVADAQTALDEARAQNEARQRELASVRKIADQAKAAGREAANLLDEANRRLRPLSVFISKKTGRLYVRQDFQKVFDAPVTISQPERPIGTHTFVSTRIVDDGSALHWMAVSMPPEPLDAKPAPRDGKRSRNAAKDDAPAAEPMPTFAPETAKGALDRITIPEDTARQLGELSWVGATVIVSDHAISGETGDTTDFIILTKRTVAQQ